MGFLRLFALHVKFRFRAAGWLPWLLCAFWCAMASLGEPSVLRSFGVHVAGQAGSAAALVLLLVVSSNGVGKPPRLILVLGNALIAVGCAAFGGAVVLFCELARGHQGAVVEATTTAVAVAIAGGPFAAGIPLYVCSWDDRSSQVIYNKLFTAIVGAWSVAAAVRVWSDVSLQGCVLASVCLLVALVMWMASSPRAAMIRANT